MLVIQQRFSVRRFTSRRAFHADIYLVKLELFTRWYVTEPAAPAAYLSFCIGTLFPQVATVKPFLRVSVHGKLMVPPARVSLLNITPVSIPTNEWIKAGGRQPVVQWLASIARVKLRKAVLDDNTAKYC